MTTRNDSFDRKEDDTVYNFNFNFNLKTGDSVALCEFDTGEMIIYYK